VRALVAALGFAVLGAMAGVQGFDPAAADQQPTAQPAPPSTPPPAQQPAGQQPPPVIRSGINYVRVDVIVSDKDGKPVMDLTQDDFSVAEDGKPQKIDAFSIVNLDHLETVENGPPRVIKNDFDEEREAARPDVRLFVILLDDYHVKRGNDIAVRKPLIEFLQNQLAPADMVAIMYPLTPITDLRFSRDREGAASAIEKFLGR
jgi:VWFA-related protein